MAAESRLERDAELDGTQASQLIGVLLSESLQLLHRDLAATILLEVRTDRLILAHGYTILNAARFTSACMGPIVL